MRLFNCVLIVLLYASCSFAGESRIMAQRVTAAGATSGSAFEVYTPTSGHSQSKPHISFFNNRFLVVWHEWNGTDLDVKAVRIEMNGTVLDDPALVIASGAHTQALPDVAADTTGWVVVWHGFNTDGTDAFPSLYARRVAYDGSIPSAAVQFGGGLGYGSAPRISWNPDAGAGNFLVIFTSLESNNYPFTRHTLLSTALEDTLASEYLQQPVQSETYYSPSVMPGGGWTIGLHGNSFMFNGQSTPGTAGLHIERDGTFDTDGWLESNNWVTWGDSPSTTGAEFFDNNDWAYGVTATATDASYAIAIWSRYHTGGSTNRNLYDGDLYAARVDGDNPVEAVGGTLVSESATNGISEVNPSLAGDGAGNLLAVYDADTDGSTEIVSKILTVDGGGIDSTTADEVTIRSDSTGGRRSHSSVAYGDDGAGTTEFMVVWTEGWWGAL